MLTIHKYPFDLADTFILTMPSVCQVLKIDHQPGTGPCLWALVDPESVPTDNVFHVVGTGQPIPEKISRHTVHLATFFDGPYVRHVFGPSRLIRGGR